MQNTGTIKCSRCGTPATADRKFCKKCGAALAPKPAAAAPAPTPQAAKRPAPKTAPPAKSAKPKAGTKPAADKQGLSFWWVVGPTLLFAYLSREPAPILIVAAIGAGLWWLKTYTPPPTADKNLLALKPFLPFAPGFQIAVVFVAVGGSIVAVALLIGAVVAATRYRTQIVTGLEPWWKIQESIPPGGRKPIAIVAAGLVGYYFGGRAGGAEWTYTLLSISFGAVVAFLILFTPPASARQAKRA